MAGRDLQRPSHQNPCSEQGHLQLEQVAQSPVPPDLKRFQEWDTYLGVTFLLDLVIQNCQHTELMAVGRSGTTSLLQEPFWNDLSRAPVSREH